MTKSQADRAVRELKKHLTTSWKVEKRCGHYGFVVSASCGPVYVMTSVNSKGKILYSALVSDNPNSAGVGLCAWSSNTGEVSSPVDAVKNALYPAFAVIKRFKEVEDRGRAILKEFGVFTYE